jgi:hypothetical protein
MALPDSDIDLTVVVDTPAAMVEVGRALGNRRLKGGQKFDAHVDTMEILADPHYAFIAARLKFSGDLIRGSDIRLQVPEPDFGRFRSVVVAQACKGIAMLRDLDNVESPVTYPNPTRPFFGYTIVRKRDWYPPGTSGGTKELVAVATYCASAWVVMHSRTWVTSKAQALRGIRQVENGARADLVERLYRLCRLKYGATPPSESTDRTGLATLCKRLLSFENEVLALREGADHG